MYTSIGNKLITDIYVNGTKTIKVFADGKQVYPPYYLVTWVYKDTYTTETTQTTIVNYGENPIPPVVPSTVVSGQERMVPLVWDDLSPITSSRTITMTYKQQYYITIISTYCSSDKDSGWYDNATSITWTSDNNHSFHGLSIRDTIQKTIYGPAYLDLTPEYVLISASSTNCTFSIPNKCSGVSNWNGIVKGDSIITYTIINTSQEGYKYSFDIINPSVNTATQTITIDPPYTGYTNPNLYIFYYAYLATDTNAEKVQDYPDGWGWYPNGEKIEWYAAEISETEKYSFSDTSHSTHYHYEIINSANQTASSGSTYKWFKVTVNYNTGSEVTANGTGWYLENSTQTTVWSVTDTNIYSFDEATAVSTTSYGPWIADQAQVIAAPIIYIRQYSITFSVLQQSGSWGQASYRVPYNTAWSSSNGVVTIENIGTNIFTPSSKTGYNIDSITITPSSGNVTSDVTITGETQYAIKYYTITLSATDGTWSVNSLSLPYGTQWTTAETSLNKRTITFALTGGDSTTAVFTANNPQTGYEIDTIDIAPSSGTVNATQTITGTTQYVPTYWTLYIDITRTDDSYYSILKDNVIRYRVNTGSWTYINNWYSSAWHIEKTDTVTVEAVGHTGFDFSNWVGLGTFSYNGSVSQTTTISCTIQLQTRTLTISSTNGSYCDTFTLTRTIKSGYDSRWITSGHNTDTWDYPNGSYDVYYGDKITTSITMRGWDTTWEDWPVIQAPNASSTTISSTESNITAINTHTKACTIRGNSTGTNYQPTLWGGEINPGASTSVTPASGSVRPNNTYYLWAQRNETRSGTRVAYSASDSNPTTTGNRTLIDTVLNDGSFSYSFNSTTSTVSETQTIYSGFTPITTPVYTPSSYYVNFSTNAFSTSTSGGSWGEGIVSWNDSSKILVKENSTISINNTNKQVTVTNIETGSRYIRTVSIDTKESDPSESRTYSFNSIFVDPSTTVTGETWIKVKVNSTNKGYSLKYTVSVSAIHNNDGTWTLTTQSIPQSVSGYSLFIPNLRVYATPVNASGQIPSSTAITGTQSFNSTAGRTNTMTLTSDTTSYNWIAVQIWLRDNQSPITDTDHVQINPSTWIWLKTGDLKIYTGTVSSKFQYHF